MHEIELPIIGEITAPIKQNLLVHPCRKDNWEEIQYIYSHSHAIAQCHKFLHRTLKEIEIIHMTSIAAAAKYILEHPEEKAGAIANELAAEEYGLAIA